MSALFWKRQMKKNTVTKINRGAVRILEGSKRLEDLQWIPNSMETVADNLSNLKFFAKYIIF